MKKANNYKVYLLAILFMGLFGPLFAQESIIKDFAEERRIRKYCFYPSTLRMINLSNNPDYNEMVKEVDKLLIYTLDSASAVSKNYLELVDRYKKVDFEEYISMYGGNSTLFVYGKEGRKNQMVGVFSEETASWAFYLKGNVKWQKVPVLINNIKENELLNLLDIDRLTDHAEGTRNKRTN